MKCPYCNAEMIKGTIYGDRYKLKWLPDTKKLSMGIWATGGIELGKGGGFAGRPKVETFMCEACHKFIIDADTEANL